MLMELIEAFVRAAMSSSEIEQIVHVDPPARYIIFAPQVGQITAVIDVDPGDRVMVFRGCRLLMEPIAEVCSRNPMRSGTWWIQ